MGIFDKLVSQYLDKVRAFLTQEADCWEVLARELEDKLGERPSLQTASLRDQVFYIRGKRDAIRALRDKLGTLVQ